MSLFRYIHLSPFDREELEPSNPRELKLQIHQIANLLWIGIAGFELLVEQARTNPQWNMFMQTRYHDSPFHIGPLLGSLRFPRVDKEFQFYETGLYIVLMRATLSNVFEHVKAYCIAHKLKQHVDDNAPWFHFARALRNAFSHDGKLTYETENDKQQILSSEWRGKKFTEDMFNKHIPMSFFDFQDLIRLIDDIGTFVDHLPDPVKDK